MKGAESLQREIGQTTGEATRIATALATLRKQHAYLESNGLHEGAFSLTVEIGRLTERLDALNADVTAKSRHLQTYAGVLDELQAETMYARR
jgi:hypothetical protein